MTRENISNSRKGKFYFIHVIVAVITLACIAMNSLMRGGLPLGNTAEQRMAFISENTAIWSGSWCIWMFAALGLFAFCSILADELKKSYLRTIGLSMVAMGIAPDLIAEVIYAFIIPKTLAVNFDINTFLLLETIATHLTGYLGNGLYNLGGLLLTLLAIKQQLIKSWVALWAVSAWLLGLALSVSIALNAMQAAEFFTATSMVLSTLWMLIFAHVVLKH